MTQIKSRQVFAEIKNGVLFCSHEVDVEVYQAIKKALAVEVAAELDMLVDKIDDFLEVRLAFEFDELKSDIKQVRAINDALMEENMRFRNEITKLTIDNMKLSMQGADDIDGTCYVTQGNGEYGELGAELILPKGKE